MTSGRNVAFAQWVVQRMAQLARTHAGNAVVEQRKQGGRGLAAQGFGEFKIASGGEIEAEVIALKLYGQRPQMRQIS